MKIIHLSNYLNYSQVSKPIFIPIPNIQAKESTSDLIYLRDGEVVLYKRPDSSVWQVRLKLFDRKWHCYSTRHNNLEYAKRSASEMYDEIRFKEKMGLGRGKKQHDKREASKDRDW